MASIGGTTCDLLKGELPTLKPEVRTWRVPGIDGYGAHLLGDGDGEFSLLAVLFDSAGNVATWLSTLEAMQGTVVTIVDTFSGSWSCLIKKVGIPRRQACLPYGLRGELKIEGVVVA